MRRERSLKNLSHAQKRALADQQQHNTPTQSAA
jgi:predicted GIY-YIG superfamily endonuclease